ncbi:MAG: hypothetical protein KJ600_03370 [Nanoarchaeota archaeon]|nr:hypothetical protein [Nanoarchaeota archaeon]MBU1103568.1 hypothetical protein [Nanoarchaeota archaeon]
MVKANLAQAWGFDLIVAMVIFLTGIVFFYMFALNYPGGEEEKFQELQHDGELIADSLLSEGSPVDWDASNVIRIGLLSGDKINESKVGNFSALDYATAKSLFRVRNNFFVYFGDETDNGIGLDSGGSENLVKLTRAVVYNNKVTTMNLHIWN